MTKFAIFADWWPMNLTPNPLVLRGQLLIANASLRDGTFDRTVILVAEHSLEKGAFGIVLNQPTDQKVDDLLDGEEFLPLKKIPVFKGGPVSPDNLLFGAFWDQNARFGYALQISVEEAAAYHGKPNTVVHAFVGYAGWSSGQLEDELEKGAWFIVDPTPSLVHHDFTPSLWRDTLRTLSPMHEIISEAPLDLLAN